MCQSVAKNTTNFVTPHPLPPSAKMNILFKNNKTCKYLTNLIIFHPTPIPCARHKYMILSSMLTFVSGLFNCWEPWCEMFRLRGNNQIFVVLDYLLLSLLKSIRKFFVLVFMCMYTCVCVHVCMCNFFCMCVIWC